MTNQEAKMAWAEGKKLEWRCVHWEDGSWAALTGVHFLDIFDDPNAQFRIVQEPVVLECVVEDRGIGTVIYCGEKVVARCYDLGIDPPVGATVRMTVEVDQ